MLQAKNIIKSYKDRVILRGISLSCNVGEIVGILGPNGAGKTTLFSILSGMLHPDSGEIRLNGIDVTRLKIHKRARAGIVYLPQDASIFTGLSVEDNIKAILQITYTDEQSISKRLNELLDMFSISHLKKSMSTFLSGGERRKVEIARALATSPSFLMLDEPFAGIDPISVGEISDILRKLSAFGTGIIVTDHNIRETLQVIDRGYIISAGEILTDGTAQEIATNQRARKQYLGDAFRI